MDKKAALSSLIDDTQEALNDLQAQAKALEEDLVRVRFKMVERQRDLDAFTQAYARYLGEAHPAARPVAGHFTMELLVRTIEKAGGEPFAAIEDDMEAVRWRTLPRIEAVEAVLAEATAPLHRHEVTELLHGHARTDEVDDVSAALSFLSRNGRAERLEGNRWAATAAIVDSAVAATTPVT